MQLHPFLKFTAASASGSLEINSAATVNILATNENPHPGSNPITVQSLEIKIPIGGDARQLTTDIPDVTPPPDQGWDAQEQTTQGDHQVYPFLPQSGDVGAQGVVFEVTNFTVNGSEGQTSIIVTQVTEGGSHTSHLPLVKGPFVWTPLSLTANPPAVSSGGSTTLQWQGPVGTVLTITYLNGASQEITIPSGDQQPLASEGTTPVDDLTETTTFYLTATLNIPNQPSQSKTTQITVTVE